MKINLPVTDVEYPYPKGKTLVSKTDLKGIITYANDVFVELSGFSREELYGKNHNIVRHPDMPPEAFDDLWKAVKAGCPWHGVVKNRCKNGNYYWVDAFVVPIRENNLTIGYMSVRKEPLRQQVAACEALYKEIREKRARLKTGSAFDFIYNLSFDTRYALFVTTMLMLQAIAVAAGLSDMPEAAVSSLAVGLVLGFISVIFMSRTVSRPLREAIDYFEQIAQGNLNNDIPISGKSGAARVLTALAATQVHLRVIIDEIALATRKIQRRCVELDEDVNRVTSQSQRQQDRVMQVGAAMEEVSVSVSEVARGAESAADAAKISLDTVTEGGSRIMHSMASTSRVVQAVQDSGATINKLSQSIQQIDTITKVIKSIADQTNLLALNAAIEAARAGEQGRGFSVVADEVRHLAERTAASTADITKMVNEIQFTASQAVTSMDDATREVEEGREMLQTSSDSFQQITSTSSHVTEMAKHIASAAVEQSTATDEVARNMEQMSALIDENSASIVHVGLAVEELAATADELHKLVAHFDATV
ncbi:MAG: PAS domain-containing methyl-accepting chemotaxis protein [Sulfurimicrobium sp.]|nr:PAS domain-containing methyl-accepting chemotaxis protein [Sulfurimicrobium sp.]